MRLPSWAAGPSLSYVVLILVGSFLPSPSRTQAQDTLTIVLPPLEIQATRGTESEVTAPYSIALLSRSAEALAVEAPVTLTEILRTLPGVWMNDRSHFALGERLSIRGMGWRAAFGVRGVQVLLDGMPLTMPDGQAILDIVDPTMVRSAELIRGPSALFWGNGSGGVLFLTTQAPPGPPAVRARLAGGSYGLRQFSAETQTVLGRHQIHAFTSLNEREGYRDYSSGHFLRTGIHATLNLKPTTQLKVHLAFADQDTESPGSLTAAQLADDPRLADPRNVNSQAGKESLQIQVSNSLRHQMPFGVLTATAYGLIRDLDNPLSFAYIGLDRHVLGGRMVLERERPSWSWSSGVDVGWQLDDRRNWNNANGQPGDDLRLDQQETVRNVAAFAYISYALAPRLSLSAGLRGDHIRFDMDDALLTNGDQSGDRTFSAISPGIGVRYDMPGVLLYANVRTAFETPTTTELVNRPDLDGGFNTNLDPQRVAGYELGTRGLLKHPNVFFDIAVFYMQVTNRLLPAESPDGRTYYQNTDGTTHLGAEIALQWQPAPAWQFDATFAATHYRFDNGTFDANALPGLPEHHIVFGTRWTQGNTYARLTAEAVSSYYTDDANTTENDGYFLVDLNLGHTDLALGELRLQPFAAVYNLLDTRYNGSVIVNAFGGRYFEPAPGRAVHIGVTLVL